MKLKLYRMWANDEETLGMMSIENIEECFILEDQYQEKKVKGETRISQGTYKIILRTYGKTHEKYKKLFPFHKGVLELENVPNFTDILIHKGLDDSHTKGCLLTGRKAKVKDGEIVLESSTDAYISFYKKVMPYIDNLYIQIT